MEEGAALEALFVQLQALVQQQSLGPKAKSFLPSTYVVAVAVAGVQLEAGLLPSFLLQLGLKPKSVSEKRREIAGGVRRGKQT
jgi:hypothetical protein